MSNDSLSRGIFDARRWKGRRRGSVFHTSADHYDPEKIAGIHETKEAKELYALLAKIKADK